MLFNSYLFLFIFLPFTFVGYFILTHQRLIVASKFWLVVASLFFYSYWDVDYLWLLLTSIFVNYGVGMLLSQRATVDAKQKYILFFGILFNISLLGFFKYADFILFNLNYLGTEFSLLHIILPLGISFFTFTQIAFLVDSFKQGVKEYSLLNYMLFVTYFPHLLAGPILHHAEMMPQFINRWNLGLRWSNVSRGLFLFSIGLFKKVIIADTFAIWANEGFDIATELNFFEAWATSLSYTFQLYFDFSGYTDMAIGISLLFNIKLPINFNSPYKALNIQDFWRRWHITLSRFLRDYIYIPLGGNRVNTLQQHFNFLIVFLVGGFWHGAAWTFCIWGLLHGIAIILHSVWKNSKFKMPSWLAWIITFNFINITWIFFRGKDFESIHKILSGMTNIHAIVLPKAWAKNMHFLEQFHIKFGQWLENIPSEINVYIVIGIGFIMTLMVKNSNEMVNTFKPNKFNFIITAFLFSFSVVLIARNSEFLYFRF